ncbi:unnamed protein product [Trichogramma brassicae]|uniref:Mutator-like transposase domain-containing protein n=1 Tax=Trichogramma brassicae TaxID=86971 RepID=A0A6H5JA92_9HYME|nr:unnamed protein product [Trichogramma brassicae]
MQQLLPLLFVMAMVNSGCSSSSTASCPDSCECRAPVIECRVRVPELDELDQLAADYHELRVHRVDQEQLRPYVGGRPNSTFLAGLQALQLTNCTSLSDLHYLHWDVLRSNGANFPVLPNVRLLNVSHNQLADLQGYRRVDRKVANQLRTLDASHNRISGIGLIDFRHTAQLTWLSLASNRLDYLSPANFRPLQALEHLDLADNALHNLEGIFDSLAALLHLNVAGNKLEHVQASWFQNLSRLAELDISRNKLTFVPADTLQPLASLSVFKLAENPLIERDLSLLLGTGRRLEAVDASRIGLLRVPAALTRSVRTLKLMGNQLTINSGDLDSYPLLRSLDVSDNRLMIIEDDALGRLDGLEELVLSGNLMPNIPKSLPSGLKLLNLRQNAISKLRSNDLQGLYLLKELNLSGNVISCIEGESFRQLPALEILDISDNPIKKLLSDTLSGPSNLVQLRMSGLMALEVERDQNQDTAFPVLQLERLVSLDVSRSPVLAAQLLADNAALPACRSLQRLDLAYTNVSAIRSDLAYQLPQLRLINLIGNKWNCSPDQRWLGEWLRQHPASIEYSTKCVYPPAIEGKPLEKMQRMPPRRERINDDDGDRPATAKLDVVDHSNLVLVESATSEENVVVKSSKEQLRNKVDLPDASERGKESRSSSSSSSDSPLLTTSDVGKMDNTVPTSESIIISTPQAATTAPAAAATLKIQESEKVNKAAAAAKINKSRDFSSINSRQAINATNGEEWLLAHSTSNGSSGGSGSEARTTQMTRSKMAKLFTPNAAKSIAFNKRTAVTAATDAAATTLPPSATTNANPTTAAARVTKRQHAATKNEDKELLSRTAEILMKTTDSIAETSTTTTTRTTTTAKSVPPSTTPSKTERSESIKNDDGSMNKYKVAKKDSLIYEEKSTSNQVVSDFSRSKLLRTNSDDEISSNVPSVSTGELLTSSSSSSSSSQLVTQSGAHTSETVTSEAHPGMLVLLGAAIGAAAALTVILSRRATAKRRDHQRYQRHENIEKRYTYNSGKTSWLQWAEDSSSSSSTGLARNAIDREPPHTQQQQPHFMPCLVAAAVAAAAAGSADRPLTSAPVFRYATAAAAAVLVVVVVVVAHGKNREIISHSATAAAAPEKSQFMQSVTVYERIQRIESATILYHVDAFMQYFKVTKYINCYRESRRTYSPIFVYSEVITILNQFQSSNSQFRHYVPWPDGTPIRPYPRPVSLGCQAMILCYRTHNHLASICYFKYLVVSGNGTPFQLYPLPVLVEFKRLYSKFLKHREARAWTITAKSKRVFIYVWSSNLHATNNSSKHDEACIRCSPILYLNTLALWTYLMHCSISQLDMNIYLYHTRYSFSGTYRSHRFQLLPVVEQASNDVMKAAAEEEKQIAIADGRVINDIPYIDVEGDGGYGKRSYRTGRFNSLDGVGVVIGRKSKKVLDVQSAELGKNCLQIIGGAESEHWICLHYDGSDLTLYDSLCRIEYTMLASDEKKYLKKRFPEVEESNILIPWVTRQPDGISCGVYAIAFAVEIALGGNPTLVNYSQDVMRMRSHLVEIIRTKQLSLFPRLL